jgi:hypothetical protein
MALFDANVMTFRAAAAVPHKHAAATRRHLPQKSLPKNLSHEGTGKTPNQLRHTESAIIEFGNAKGAAHHGALRVA